MSSRHKVLSVKLMWEYLIPSSSYYEVLKEVKRCGQKENAYDFLLKVEDIVIEEFVELFIGEVDTQLLEGVHLIRNLGFPMTSGYYKWIRVTSKFSKPKISSTPMKRLASLPGFVQELI